MVNALTREEACSALGVDDWGLERLIAMGDLSEVGDGFDAKAVERLAHARAQRRADALADIADLDAPHLGLVP